MGALWWAERVFAVGTKFAMMGGSVLPVRALVPSRGFAHLFCSPALEMLSASMKNRLLQNNPYTILRVLDEAFQGDTKTLEWLISEGVLCWREPAFYIYVHRRAGETTRGLLASVDACGVVLLGHEEVFAHKLEEQKKVIATMGVQPYPVMLVAEQERPLVEVIEKAMAAARALYSFEDPLGDRILLYEVDSRLNMEVQQKLSQIREFLIADGHHRVSVLHQAYPGSCVLSALFPASMVRVSSYMRCVRTSLAKVLMSVERNNNKGTVQLTIRRGTETRVVNGSWGSFVEAMHWLDSRLQELVEEVEILPPVRAPEDSEKVVFEVSAPAIEEIFSVARQGHTMPPKSTWFVPKIQLGVLMSEL